MYLKYSGAGNDFVVIDGRALSAEELGALRRGAAVRKICSRKDGFRTAGGTVGADGMMILLLPDRPGTDFRMEYYNSDGSTGMMCGNGGRCIVAFAASLGMKPMREEYVFEAPDGIHSASLLADGRVRLKMSDAAPAAEVADPEGGLFLNTGTRHLVLSVEDVAAVDVEHQGRRMRHLQEFSPEGVNVNFVSRNLDGSLSIRTYEKGVEAETLACGTGAVAAALASGLPSPVLIHARGGDLEVEYKKTASGFTDVYLTGGAERNSYSLVALTENGRVRMVPSLENEMKKAYEEKIARLDSQEYDDEQEWLLARSAAWEEYAEFFLSLGNLRQAYHCYEKAATVISPCSEQLWVQNMNCERPVMPLYYRFLAMHDKCRHLIGQRPELLDEYNGSELQRNYLFYTEDERADSREMLESYQSMKAWDFGKD